MREINSTFTTAADAGTLDAVEGLRHSLQELTLERAKSLPVEAAEQVKMTYMAIISNAIHAAVRQKHIDVARALLEHSQGRTIEWVDSVSIILFIYTRINKLYCT